MAGRTRTAVIAAATRLFVQRGWSGTSMRDVAAEAGCAIETVYSSVGNKRALLKVALDVAVVGDDDPVPLLDRPQFRAIAEGDLGERAAATGRFAAWIFRRTAHLDRVLAQAASGDAELAELLVKNRTDHRVSVDALAAALARRPVTRAQVDGLTAVLSNEVYLLLTEGSGWTDRQYGSWVADTVVRLLDLDYEE
ncbi:TetR/AcrR family transcriptional regulator [Prescottella agglutinans]|uniref:TetR/AcrR family transcriptional regulator n=2 Tax=Prescottella agglutinans TaxID=1644129 RepID=A0A3S3AI68_9NOCA|nr:TetR/AcrR family transcriptional regulator [Prescottella agglutinans]